MSTDKDKRLSYWLEQRRLANEALGTGAWWNGKTWKPASERPRTPEETVSRRTAVDRLCEISEAIMGYTPAVTAYVASDDDAPVQMTEAVAAGQTRAARRFAQSGNAMDKDDERKEEATYAWDVLVAKFGKERLLRGPNDLDLQVECVAELERARFKNEEGMDKDWTTEGVKSLIRRRRKRL